jgi:hypothetical protein
MRFSLEKLDVEPGFQRVDAVAQCSRRQVQFMRGFLEAAATRGCLDKPLSGGSRIAMSDQDLLGRSFL